MELEAEDLGVADLGAEELKAAGDSSELNGEEQKMRPPETLNCSESKMWRPRKLKLHQPVNLIR